MTVVPPTGGDSRTPGAIRDAVATFAASTRGSRIPPSVQRFGQVLFVDTLGALVGGLRYPQVHRLGALLREAEIDGTASPFSRLMTLGTAATWLDADSGGSFHPQGHRLPPVPTAHPAPRGAVLPDQVRLDLQWMARDFETLLATAPTDRLGEPTDGTRWTNRQVLWHMAFGQHIARVLLPLMSGFSKLPASASRRYANTLSAASRPYDWVNYAGSVAGARVTGLRLARRWMRRDTDRLLGWGARATDAQLASGMSVPADWDPYFTPWMSRCDVLVWTKKHYDHHRAQLTLDTAESPLSGPRGGCQRT